MKKVLITGSGSGLGKEAAIALARRGHTVYASVHYKNQIDELNSLAQKENVNLSAFKLDILNENDRKLILNYDIDVFISNAAIGDSGSVAEIDINRIKNVFDTNIYANLHTIQLALSKMIEKGRGRVVIISSLAGRSPIAFLSPYCASKCALDGFGICLNQEMKLLNKLSGTNIEISLIEPGAYATGFNKENNSKKYEWMYENSYFSDYASLIEEREIKIWNFLEQKSYDSIVKKYIKAVEDKKCKFRYTAPWWRKE